MHDSLTLALTESMIGNLMQFREVVALELQNLTFEDKRRWLEILDVRITVTDGNFVISGRLHSAQQLRV